MLASLWWSKVLARCRSTRTGTTSLLDAQGSALNDFTLETLLGGISLLSSDHLDEAKATRLLGVGIKHDLALLDITVFLKETSDLLLRETRMDTSDEEVGSRVDCTIILGRRATVGSWATAGGLKHCSNQYVNKLPTGYQGVRCHWEKQSGEVHEDSHCDDLGEGTRCDHARNAELHLRVNRSSQHRELQGIARDGI
jgi:hypothetical protein